MAGTADGSEEHAALAEVGFGERSGRELGFHFLDELFFISGRLAYLTPSFGELFGECFIIEGTNQACVEGAQVRARDFSGGHFAEHCLREGGT